MKRRWFERLFAAALTAFLAAAAIFIRFPGKVLAEDNQIVPTESGTAGEESPAGSSETAASSEMSEEEFLAEKPEEDPGIRREKYYMLEAMDKLQVIGLSPIKIWAKVTGNEKVMDTVRDLGKSAADTVTDVVSEKVSEAGDAVSQKAGEAASTAAEKVQEQAKQAGSAAAEQVQEQIHEAGKAVTEKAEEGVQEQADKTRKGLLETIRGWIHDTFG